VKQRNKINEWFNNIKADAEKSQFPQVKKFTLRNQLYIDQAKIETIKQ